MLIIANLFLYHSKFIDNSKLKFLVITMICFIASAIFIVMIVPKISHIVIIVTNNNQKLISNEKQHNEFLKDFLVTVQTVFNILIAGLTLVILQIILFK